MVNFMGRIRDIHSQYTRLQRAPLLMLYCRDTFPLDVPRQQQLFDHTIQKSFPAIVKTYVDTDIKLQTTLHVMRACRLANYVFCANTPIAALVLELPFVTSYMPKVPVLTVQLQLDLSAYKSAAIHYLERYPLDVVDGKISRPTPNQCWKFWQRNMLLLPNWYAFAAVAALVRPSSCSCERLFAAYTSGFGDDQQSSLEDYKEASTMLSYNQNCRLSEGDVI